MAVRSCRSWSALLAALAAATLSGSCGGGGSPFDDPFWSEDQVQVADVNGDGLADVLTLSTWIVDYPHHDGHLKVYLQTAPGLFAAPLDHLLPRGPWHFVLGDVDGDGRPDVVATHPDLDQVSVLLQDATRPGQFRTPQVFDAGGDVYEVALGDFDGDGHTDIVASDDLATSSGLVLLRQDPASPGRFLAPQRLAVGHPTFQVVAADFDDDGRLDLAAAGSGRVTVLRQGAGGTFGVATTVATVDPRRSLDFLAAADMNGDGRADLVFAAAANVGAGIDAAEVGVVLREAAPGTFAAAVLTGRSGAESWTYALGDVDGDGRPDLAQAKLTRDPDVLLQRAQAPTALVAAASLDVPAPIGQVAIGDVDADGRPDVVATGYGLVLVRHQGTTPFSFGPPVTLR